MPKRAWSLRRGNFFRKRKLNQNHASCPGAREAAGLAPVSFTSNTCNNGGGDVQVVEPPDAIKTVLVRWSKVMIDLNELARLRWIKKMTTPEICRAVGKARSAVQVSLRTLRNCGISQLNLTESERKVIENAIHQEIAVFTRTQKNFKLSTVSEEFRK